MNACFRNTLVAAAAAVAFAGTAQAQDDDAVPAINAPVPTNATIFQNGLQWAWAFPLGASNGMQLTFQSTLGWRLPTLAELASAPLATDFMFVGANVPLGGNDPISNAWFASINENLTGAAACATPYFSNTYDYCDWSDGLGQGGTWAGSPGSHFFYSDQLVVREAVTPIPEPSTLLLFGNGLALVGFLAYRRRA